MIFRDIYQSGFQHHTHCGEYVMCTALSDSFKAVIAKSCILMNDISRYLSVPFSTSHWLWRIRCVYCPLWSCQGCNIKITAFSCWTIFRDIYQSRLQHHANCGEYVVCTALSDCNIKITAICCWTILRDIYQSRFQGDTAWGNNVLYTSPSDIVKTIISKSLNCFVD